MSTLIYVHGTNGSGKSTLARAVGAAAGGFTEYQETAKRPNKAQKTTKRPDRCGSTYTANGVALIGRYSSACGGLDSISPFMLALPEMKRHAVAGTNVFAEGLITPGVHTCAAMANMFDTAVFIHLNTPDNECIKNFLARRARRGIDKPYDPANLYKKTKSAVGWAARLQDAGLNVKRLEWMQAYRLCLELLGLPLPGVIELLGKKS